MGQKFSANRFETLDSDNVTVREFISQDGFHQVRYRDEYVGSEWVVPQGATPPDDVTLTLGGITYRVKAFDGGTTTEWMSNMFELNHDFAFDDLNAETAKLEWHVHFLPSNNTSGDVKWFFEYCYLPYNGAPITQNTISVIKSVASNTQYFHLIGGVELPKPTGGFHIGDLILFNIKRVPTDNEDTYNADAYMIKTALHVPVDGSGSRQRYIK